MKMKSMIAALSLAACSTFVQAPARAADQPKYDTGLIPAPHIALPDGNISAMVFLISGSKGWNDKDDQRVSVLTAEGAAVVGIDYPSYMK